MEFHHLGIIVEDLESATTEFIETIGGTRSGEEIHDRGLGITIQFLKDKTGFLYELIQPTNENSKIFSALKSKNHLHHIAYKVNDIEQSVVKFRNNRFGALTGFLNAKAFNNKRIIFLLSPRKYIVELIEA